MGQIHVVRTLAWALLLCLASGCGEKLDTVSHVGVGREEAAEPTSDRDEGVAENDAGSPNPRALDAGEADRDAESEGQASPETATEGVHLDGGEESCVPIAVRDPLINDFENGEVNFESPNGIPQNWHPGGVLGEEREFGVVPRELADGSSDGLAFRVHGFGTAGTAGVRFWDCYAVPHARGIRLSVRLDANTDRLTVRADTSANAPIGVGGRCDGCLQNYARLTLESGWQEITILFEEFGGGTHPFDPTDQIGFSFQWSSLDQDPIDWELWLDDVNYVF